MTNLEAKYLSQIVELQRAKKRPRVTDWFWVGRFKRKLNKRLIKLNEDYEKGLITDLAYSVWSKMINDVL